MSEFNIAKVAVDNTAYHFDKAYDYRIPDALADRAKKGCRVTVSFGASSRKRQGMIMDIVRNDENDKKVKLKAISEVLDSSPLLNSELLSLAEWIKERTFCTLYDAVKAMLPSGINYKIIATYAAITENLDMTDTDGLSDDEKTVYSCLCQKTGYIKSEKLSEKLDIQGVDAILEELVKKGFAVRNYDTVRKIGDLTVKMICLSEEYLSGRMNEQKLSAKQQTVVDMLSEIGSASVKEICYYTGFTSSVPASLESKGIVEIYDDEIYRNPHRDGEAEINSGEIILTECQSRAFNSLISQYNEHKGGASLLFGVTGSGKTKVYMRLIDEIIKENKGVILMVPEISLTPQALKLFRERYGKTVAVFHSALSVGERLDEWKRVKNGEAKMVVGTRSAIFAPLSDIGLIIVDEEQESTYKSESNPRYNAKDVARFRCAKNNALLVLASATPSIESYALAMKGKYTLNVLDERYGSAELPEVETVDMCCERRNGNSSEISGRLMDALDNNLKMGQQSILLINRRGYNTFASCTNCGHVITCPSCSISMTYHHANGRLMCHYCGYSTEFSPNCPMCGNPAVKYSGFGTQKVEDDIARALSDARILRMDTDTTMTKYSHEEKLKRFADRDFDILIGTQMVAKGLDFENVTLVGVVSVDQQLYNDDYRSLEKAFSLLTQVVGRSGRGAYRGKAIIQTLTPENDIIALAAKQDYRAFFNTEIGIRRTLIYPPFCDICVIGFVGEDELFVRAASKEALTKIRLLISGRYEDEKIIVLGPMPARVMKVNNKYRYRLIIKCKNSVKFRLMISELLCDFGKDKRFNSVTVYADINPESMI